MCIRDSVIPSGRAEPGPDDVVVMSSNLQYGRADAVALTERVRALDVDILVLLEVTPSAVDLLRAAGLEAMLPFVSGHPRCLLYTSRCV